MEAGESDQGQGKWTAIIMGIIMAVPVSSILATQAPAALLALIVLGFTAWAGVRTGVLGRDEATEADPLATLQERYAAGELTEAEFERRLDRLLDSDRRRGRRAARFERRRAGAVPRAGVTAATIVRARTGDHGPAGSGTERHAAYILT